MARNNRSSCRSATAYGDSGILCLDSRESVRFTLEGERRSIDDQGSADGPRQVELANGRAAIFVATGPGPSVVGDSARSPGIAGGFIDIPPHQP